MRSSGLARPEDAASIGADAGGELLARAGPNFSQA